MARALPDRIATARLTLRPLAPGDAAAVVDGVGRYEVARWLSAVPYPYHHADAEDFIASGAAAPGETWAISDISGLAGVIGLGGTGLGYWLARRAWGRGYATEAGDAVADAWFGARRTSLRSAVFDGNDASARVLDKLGFLADGRTRLSARALSQEVDATRMVLSRDRWASRRRYRLATPRLRLREIRDGDRAAFARIGAGLRAARPGAEIRLPADDMAWRSWISEARYRGRPGFRLSILHGRRLVGCVGLDRPGHDGVPPLGGFIGPDAAGRGFAGEALGRFLPDALVRLGLGAISAPRCVGDAAGRRVLERAGFAPAETRNKPGRLEPAPDWHYRLDAKGRLP